MESLNVITALEEHAEVASQRLEPLFRLLDCPDELAFSDWLMLYALAMQHGPSRIVEVGRGLGSAVCVFIEVARATGAELVSYDLASGRWIATFTRVVDAMGEAWLPPGVLVSADFMQVSPEQVAPADGRTLLFWDAHGQDVARHIITRVFPRLEPEDLIIVHDVSDLRSRLIKGGSLRRHVGSFFSPFDELAVLHDFWTGHGTNVRSPASDAAAVMAMPSDRWARFALRLPAGARPLIGGGGHWVYFSPAPRDGIR